LSNSLEEERKYQGTFFKRGKTIQQTQGEFTIQGEEGNSREQNGFRQKKSHRSPSKKKKRTLGQGGRTETGRKKKNPFSRVQKLKRQRPPSTTERKIKKNDQPGGGGPGVKKSVIVKRGGEKRKRRGRESSRCLGGGWSLWVGGGRLCGVGS